VRGIILAAAISRSALLRAEFEKRGAIVGDYRLASPTISEGSDRPNS
jgi:hypothetical protein